MRLTIPKTVNVVELENAPFKCAKDADAWARSHGIVGLMSSVDTAGKGEIAISVHSLNKMLSGSALEKSSTPALHFAALMRLRDIIRESFVGEVHPDYIKVDGKRSPDNGINPLVEIWVLYGCASFAGVWFFFYWRVPVGDFIYLVRVVIPLLGIYLSMILAQAIRGMVLSLLCVAGTCSMTIMLWHKFFVVGAQIKVPLMSTLYHSGALGATVATVGVTGGTMIACWVMAMGWERGVRCLKEREEM